MWSVDQKLPLVTQWEGNRWFAFVIVFIHARLIMASAGALKRDFQDAGVQIYGALVRCKQRFGD